MATLEEDKEIGPLVRLWGILPSQLPPSATESQEDLTAFVAPILKEALSFISTVPAAEEQSSNNNNNDVSPWRTKGRVTFPHANAPVDLYERVVSAQELASVAAKEKQAQHGPVKRPETWFLRRSVHEDAASKGTAAWGEWIKSFKEEHAEAEMRFTPSVLRTKMLTSWDCSGVAVTLGGDDGGTWEDITLKLEESVHKMPPPLKDRVFPVLQITASARQRREFVVVQIAAVPDPRKGEEESRSDGTLRGAYTSIERFRSAGGEGGGKGVEWVMGTVSDARGTLPMWVQKMAVPGRIAKDVDMFLEWVHKKGR